MHVVMICTRAASAACWRRLSSAASSPSRSHIGKIKPRASSSKAGNHLSFPNPPQAHSGLPKTDEPYLVLGIETSCDDTGVAVVRSDGAILSNIVISQVTSG